MSRPKPLPPDLDDNVEELAALRVQLRVMRKRKHDLLTELLMKRQVSPSLLAARIGTTHTELTVWKANQRKRARLRNEALVEPATASAET